MASLPISSLEFATMLQRARPPPGWSGTVAVANSGGPDSTCLLFLLSRFLRGARAKVPSSGSPERIVSLSVDHCLQENSHLMSQHAANVAESLGVEHITTKLSWGDLKPAPHEKIEEKARYMRQMALFQCLNKNNANALAFGHHVDDQVETMFMRLGRGSGQLGLAGMRPCRRWGMGTGDRGSDDLYAIEGMRKWVVRPLLGVSKDRITATCEDNKLEYVTDPTNFQPQLTVRNALREILKNGKFRGISPQDPFSAQQTTAINTVAYTSSVAGFDLGSDISDLRKINKDAVAELLSIDETVDQLIAKHRLPSPPGTFMISPQSLKAIDSQLVREALLFRITRYVSPEPWGSPRSELGRRKSSTNRLVAHLCDIEALATRNNNSLCVGSNVWWRPVVVLDNRLRTTIGNLHSEKIAWLALRQPPQRIHTSQGVQSHNDRLYADMTSQIFQQREEWPLQSASGALKFLFDRRFLIRFHIDRVPQEIIESLYAGGQILVEPTDPWTFPRVVHLNAGISVTIQTHITPQPFHQYQQIGGRQPHKDIKSSWITIEYYRPLSSI